MQNTCYLSTAYLAPVSYYVCLANFNDVFIENHETFAKQSYRNRCGIYTANGVLNLSIPVNAANHSLIKEVKIDNSKNWQRQHWRSIMSAYNASPFFIYYDYELQPFYEKSFNYLLDFNNEIQQKLLSLLNFSVKITPTSDFEKSLNKDLDFRQLIHPKKNSLFNLQEYNQVFNDKHGFIPDLSILDLLFNQGPESTSYLLSSVDDFAKA
ncbi:MAG: WbqC family protein [Bacteroidota bacterium]|nr:WbqC family protein [Bacteroidota bacterium]